MLLIMSRDLEALASMPKDLEANYSSLVGQ